MKINRKGVGGMRKRSEGERLREIEYEQAYGEELNGEGRCQGERVSTNYEI